jgi:hypothetical protein
VKTFTDRIVLVFPIQSKGRSAAASLQTLTVLDSGRELEDLTPLDPAAIGDYAKEFSLGLIAERDALATQVAELTAEVDRITALIPPPLPARSIYPRELLARLKFTEVVAAIRTDDDAAIYAVANLQTTVSPIDLDSEETRMLIGALVLAKIISPERLAEILS